MNQDIVGSYNLSGELLYTLEFPLPDLGVFVQGDIVFSTDFGDFAYSAERTEYSDAMVSSIDDCMHFRYVSAIRNLEQCQESPEGRLAQVAKNNIALIRDIMNRFPGMATDSETPENRYMIPDISVRGLSIEARDPYFRPEVHQNYIDGHAEYYAICYDGSGRLCCINNDYSLRFKFPESSLKASPFVSGVSVVSSKNGWGAVSRNGSVLVPVEHDLVIIKGDRIVAYDGKNEDTHTITVYDLQGNRLYTQIFHYSFDSTDIPGIAKSGIDYFHEKTNRTDSLELLKAVVNCVKLDYESAERNLHICSKSKNCRIRKTAKENLKFLESKRDK